MEKRSPPANGLRLLTTLLIFYGLTYASSIHVVVPQKVNAVLGKNITLGCRIEVGSASNFMLSSWERRLPSGTSTLAWFNPELGTSISPDYAKRISFVSPSVRDATITIEGAVLADVGTYTCVVVTFPEGRTEASTKVDVLVAPKVYVSAGPAALVDGGNESLVATCVAEHGRPAAVVFWHTKVPWIVRHKGRNGRESQSRVHYMWKPLWHYHGSQLICMVHHPALHTVRRIPYKLNVQFSPRRLWIQGIEDKWYVGQENVNLTCGATYANPPALVTWTRVDGVMPEGVEISQNSFSITRPLKRNDSGVYRCEVINDIGRNSKDVTLWVQDAPNTTPEPTTPSITTTISSTISLPEANQGMPRFVKSPEDQIGISGGVASFVCLATGEPKPRITWMEKGKKVSSQRLEVIEFDGGSVLRIQPLRTHRDEAIYECIANNSAGEIKTSAKLTVLEEAQLSMITNDSPADPRLTKPEE